MLPLIIVVVILTNSFALTAPNIKERIIGGTEVNIFVTPYQASVHHNGKHLCGGSIISTEYILSAAHCVHFRAIRALSVNVGGSYHSTPLHRIPVYRFKIHENYNSTTYDNDIAILQIVSRMSFGPNVLPIALPNQDEHLPDGSVGITSGWGQMFEFLSFLSGKLRIISLPTISKELCQVLNAPKIVTDNMICATDQKGGKDTCQGDSGSGFVSRGKLFGITSWGIGCGRRERAGVYTKVSKYRNWIRFYTGV